MSETKNTRVVILAGGKGTRLAPYTTVLPKPLMPLGDSPILEIILKQLARFGMTDITMSVGHLAELVEAYFITAKSRLPELNVTFIRETDPMGTAGSLGLMERPEGSFVVMNGDILTTLDYKDLLSFHRSKGAKLTIATYSKEVKIDLGVIETDSDGFLTGYIEKPESEYRVSMGIYVYEPSVLDYIKEGEHLDFPDLVLRLLENNEKVASYEFSDYWLDIGRHEDYVSAQEEFERMKDKFLGGAGDSQDA